ncbi:hypothetical protein GQ55_9G226200 [Panicum hallii var. hallii]|uniref:Uncharacterized protein n=1 Tax=Panicum hallii var. hallii TaxID=1504633 RepID=A0A2T7C645_9POAL|nr:hypothetical protein GQ55_9G226200 [Panicum hallii var. hallii]
MASSATPPSLLRHGRARASARCASAEQTTRRSSERGDEPAREVPRRLGRGAALGWLGGVPSFLGRPVPLSAGTPVPASSSFPMAAPSSSTRHGCSFPKSAAISIYLTQNSASNGCSIARDSIPPLPRPYLSLPPCRFEVPRSSMAPGREEERHWKMLLQKTPHNSSYLIIVFLCQYLSENPQHFIQFEPFHS